MEYVGVSILNVILVKEKLLVLGYYKRYSEPDVIKLARGKNDYMIHKIFDATQ